MPRFLRFLLSSSLPTAYCLLPTAGLVLVVFGRLAAEPGGVLVDEDRIHRDDAVRPHDRSIGNALTRLFLPLHRRIADRIARTGRVPYWDEAGFGGRPFVGNPQAGLSYPP